MSLALSACPRRVQPLHVIVYALFQWEAWFITKRAACIREIGLGEILVMRVRIVEVWNRTPKSLRTS